MHLYQAQRNLADQSMNMIDVALGHPVDPLNSAHRTRNFLMVGSASEGESLEQSGYWEKGRVVGNMIAYHVNESGQAALAAHLKAIGDTHTLFAVTHSPEDAEAVIEEVAATSHENALNRLWSALDRVGIQFSDFCTDASVRPMKVEPYEAV